MRTSKVVEEQVKDLGDGVFLFWGGMMGVTRITLKGKFQTEEKHDGPTAYKNAIDAAVKAMQNRIQNTLDGIGYLIPERNIVEIDFTSKGITNGKQFNWRVTMYVVGGHGTVGEEFAANDIGAMVLEDIADTLGEQSFFIVGKK